MAALKKLQAEKDSGDWESLTEQAQQQVCVVIFLGITLDVLPQLVLIINPLDRKNGLEDSKENC